jgi:hypothetical protein
VARHEREVFLSKEEAAALRRVAAEHNISETTLLKRIVMGYLNPEQAAQFRAELGAAFDHIARFKAQFDS